MSYNIKIIVFLGKYEEIKLFYGRMTFFFKYLLSYHLYKYLKINLYLYDS